jgi:hypothetical protein
MWLNGFTALVLYLAFVFGVYLLAFYLLVRDKEKKICKNLEEKLKSDDPFERMNAIMRVSGMGLKAKIFIPKLVELLEDKNEAVIENSKFALIEIAKSLQKTKNDYDEVLDLINNSIPKHFSIELNSSLALNPVLPNVNSIGAFVIKKSEQKTNSRKLKSKKGKRKK